MAITFVFVFLAAIILINYRNFTVKDYGDFATSNGSFGMLAVSLAVFSTWYTGSIYTAWSDFSVVYGFIGIYVMIYSSLMLIFMYLASERVYLWGKKYRIKTQGEFVDLRYRSKPLRLLVGLAGVAFVAPWLILEWLAQGFVFHYATGGAFSPFAGMLIGVVVVLIYVATGGMRSVIKANVLQGSYMFLIGVGLMFYLIYYHYGSFGEAMNLLKTDFNEVLTFPGPGWEQPYTYWTSIVLTSGLGALMLPYIFNKMLVADSVKSLKRSSLLASILSVIFWVAFSLLGQVLHTYDYARENPYEAYLWIADLAGPIPLALMSTLIISTSISSTAAIIQAISSSIVTDISEVINRKITDKTSILIARIAVVIIAIVTVIVASFEHKQLIFQALLTYQGIAILFPIVMLGLFWKRANRLGAMLALIVGVAVSMYVSIVQPSFLVSAGWQGGIYGVLVAFLIMFVCGYLRPVEAHVDQLWDDIEIARAKSKLKMDEKTKKFNKTI